MKRTFLTMSVIAIAILIGLSACNKGDNPWNPGGDDMMMTSEFLPDEYMPDFDAAEFTVEGDIEADDLAVYPDFNGYSDSDGNMNEEYCGGDRGDRGRMGGRYGDMMRKRMGPGFELRQLFWKLRLTREQGKELYGIMKDYHECVHDIMIATAEQRHTIMEKAREARQEIIAKYREDGDREAAREALKVLYTRVKEALDNLVDKDALCDCYLKMLRQVYNILDERQQEVFMNWLKTSKNPCVDGFNLGDRG